MKHLHREPKFDFVCSKCLQRFPSKEGVETHCLTKNEEKNDKLHQNSTVLHQCIYCKDIFDNKEEFLEHWKNAHESKLKPNSKRKVKLQTQAEDTTKVRALENVNQNHELTKSDVHITVGEEWSYTLGMKRICR